MNRIVKFAAFAALPLAGAALMAAGPQEPTKRAGRKFDGGVIVWSSGDLKMTAEEFRSLPQRVGAQVLASDALKSVKGWNPGWRVDAVHLEGLAVTYGRGGAGEVVYYTGQDRLALSGDVPEADRAACSRLLIAAINEHLQRMYDELSTKDLRNLQFAQRDLKRTEEELQVAWDREAKLRDQFVKNHHRPLPATDEALATEEGKSASDILDAELAILGAAKRKDALETNLKNSMEQGQLAKKELEHKLESRRRIVALRREDLENVKKLHQTGAAPSSEVRKAEIQVAEAESQLENETLLARRALDDQMNAARTALAQTRDEYAAAEERLKFLRSRSTGSAEMQKLVREQRRAKQRAEDLERDARELWKKVRELERRANLADPPSVRRLGDPA